MAIELISTSRSREAGLNLNINKIKIILGNGRKQNMVVNGETIEEVDEVVYLGQMISFKNWKERETRRTKKAWASF